MKERMIVALQQVSNLSAISWWEQVSFRWDDDDARFVLYQHVQFDFYRASSLKQVDTCCSTFNTLSWFWVNQSLLLLLNAACSEDKQQIPLL
jgi:hypothetical protein